MNNPEAPRLNPENHVDLAEAAERQSEKLAAKHEKAGEQQVESVDAVRDDVKEFFAKEAGKETKQGGEPSGFRAVRQVTTETTNAAYNQTMRLIRAEMNRPSRAFSKVIHSPVIERSSEVIGGTLARPNAILAGSTTALVLVICVYILARTFGYRLSGFETIGAFLLGWAIGLIYDYVRVMALGRR